MTGGHGSGDGAPIEESNIEEDRGEMGMSRRAVGTGLVGSTGEGMPDVHFWMRRFFWARVAGEMS